MILYSMVSQQGFEPQTYTLEGCCSIQLRYWDINKLAEMGLPQSQVARILTIIPS